MSTLFVSVENLLFWNFLNEVAQILGPILLFRWFDFSANVRGVGVAFSARERERLQFIQKSPSSHGALLLPWFSAIQPRGIKHTGLLRAH